MFTTRYLNSSRMLAFACILFLGFPCVGEDLSISKIEPPNWWVSMKHNQVQVMLYGTGLTDVAVESVDARIDVGKVHNVANEHYAFVDLIIPANLSPGKYALKVSHGVESVNVDFPVLARATKGPRHQGFTAEDVIYLITPDRFANGDRSNDQVAGMLDEYDPTNDKMRHGGDLRGILQRLDYLADLGVTAVWLNPVLENNGVNSYHGYKATDLYKIDPRFGTNEEYRELATAAHERGIKVIFDHVSNHIGIRHPWVSDRPTKDWFNGTVEDHLLDKHNLLSVTDPHADARATTQLKSFWFVDSMPDMNQRNPLLAKYLIQNSLWWIEYAGLDGIREDTYPYADQSFLADWAKSLRAEYPDFNIVGEIWATKSAYIAHFQEKSILPRDFETHLPAVMDFPLAQSFRDFLSGKGKLRDVHATYAQDFLFTDTSNLMVFLDNHDTPRALFEAEGDSRRVRLCLAIMMLGRGIPQILYGTEIDMLGGKSHVELRADFPGGFPNATRSAFTVEGRTAKENAMFDYVQSLLKFRKQHSAISRGKMIHYRPHWFQDVYRFVRIDGDDRVVVVANGESDQQTVDVTDMEHHFNGGKLRDAWTGEWVEGQKVEIDGVTARVFTVVKSQ